MNVVITGASAGIGAALAKALHARGAKLVLAARRIDRLNELNAELGGGHVVVQADVGKPQDCRRLVDEAFVALGRIDTLVLNAGYGVYPRVHETSPEATRAIFATNVFGTTDCIYAAVPRMLNQDVRDGVRGQLMIVSSAAARRAPPYLGIYSATKAAQLSIAEAMRVELSPLGLAVTSVHPGMTSTEFGRVAEGQGDIKLPSDDRTKSQSVEHVAAKMLAAIERPHAEVWPMRRLRWAMPVAAFWPGGIDRLLGVYRRRVEAANRAE